MAGAMICTWPLLVSYLAGWLGTHRWCCESDLLYGSPLLPAKEHVLGDYDDAVAAAVVGYMTLQAERWLQQLQKFSANAMSTCSGGWCCALCCRAAWLLHHWHTYCVRSVVSQLLLLLVVVVVVCCCAQVQGLDPATAEPAAALAALQAQLSPQQQAEVDAEAQRLFAEVS
jgi:hypothetical protein